MYPDLNTQGLKNLEIIDNIVDYFEMKDFEKDRPYIEEIPSDETAVDASGVKAKTSKKKTRKKKTRKKKENKEAQKDSMRLPDKK